MRLQRKHNEGEAVISADDVQRLSRILAGEMPTMDDADAEGPEGR